MDQILLKLQRFEQPDTSFVVEYIIVKDDNGNIVGDEEG